MDSILSEVYSTVLPAAPYVLAAYIGIWLVLFIFVLALWHQRRHRSPQAGARGPQRQPALASKAPALKASLPKAPVTQIPVGERGRRFFIKYVDDERVWTMNR